MFYSPDEVLHILNTCFIVQTGLESPENILKSYFSADQTFENAPKYFKLYFIAQMLVGFENETNILILFGEPDPSLEKRML